MQTSRSRAGFLTAAAGLVSRASTQIFLLVVTIAAGRYLSPADFGSFAIAAACVMFGRNLLYSGSYEYLLRAPAGRGGSLECLSLNLIVASVLTGALLLAGLTVFNASTIGLLIVVLAPSNLFAAFTSWQEAHFLRTTRVQSYYGLTFTSDFLAAAVTLGMLAAGYGLYSLVAQTYVRIFILLIGYAVLIRPSLVAGISLARFREVFRWSFARYGSVVLNFLTEYGADLLLGAFLSPAATGIYRAGSRIASAAGDTFAQPARVLAMTLFSSRSAKGLPATDLAQSMFKTSAFIGWPALVVIAVAADVLVPLLLGQRWAEASTIVSILCLGRAFALTNATTVPLLVAYSRNRHVFIVQAAAAVVIVTLLGIFARFGPDAAAWCAAGCAIFAAIWYSYLVFSTFEGTWKGFLRNVPAALVPVAVAGLTAEAAKALLLATGAHQIWVALGIVTAGALSWLVAAYSFKSQLALALHALALPPKADAPSSN